MAPDHHTSERVYASLKCDLLGGALGSGRLNIAALEDRYATSATPVREAMLRLVGERLVEMRSIGGFAPWQPSAAEARGLYEFNQKMLAVALGWRGGVPEPLAWSGVDQALDPPVDRLFLTLAERSGNRALLMTIASLNDRLHPLRRAEQIVLSGLQREYSFLGEALGTDSPTGLRRAITAYHARRLRHLDAIVGALGRTR